MKIFFAFLMVLFFAAANAGSGQGTIAKVENGPLYGSKVFITIDGYVADQPACRSAGSYHFAFDTSAAGGKDLLALVLIAKTTKQNVVISGFGSCNLYSGVEDLRWFRVE